MLVQPLFVMPRALAGTRAAGLGSAALVSACVFALLGSCGDAAAGPQNSSPDSAATQPVQTSNSAGAVKPAQSSGPAVATAASGGSMGMSTQGAPHAGAGAPALMTSAMSTGAAGRMATVPAGGVGAVAGASSAMMTSAAQAGAGAAAAGSGSAMQPGRPAGQGPRLPMVTSTDGPGPFKTTQDLQSGPKKASGLFRPDELGKDGLLHPVFVWGCGGQSTPSSYSTELNKIASHGFVIIAEVEEIGDNGAPLLAALDWISAENERADSMLFHKLDIALVGLGGHSIGSVNSFFAGTDPRWTTTIHVAGGSLDNVNDPSAPTTGKGGKALIHPTAYICSESDIFGNVEKAQKDYDNTTVPVFFTIMAGAEHIGAVGDGLPVIIAWLRWQLAGEEERRKDFLDPMGMFSTGRYMTRTKNW